MCSPICGDGIKVGSEGCDDGNTKSGDGCSSTCQIEKNYFCNETPKDDKSGVPSAGISTCVKGSPLALQLKQLRKQSGKATDVWGTLSVPTFSHNGPPSKTSLDSLICVV